MTPEEIQKEVQTHYDTVQNHLQKVPPSGQMNQNHLSTILHDVLKALGFFLRLFESPQPLTNGNNQPNNSGPSVNANLAGGGTGGGNPGNGPDGPSPSAPVDDTKSAGAPQTV